MAGSLPTWSHKTEHKLATYLQGFGLLALFDLQFVGGRLC
jgi:hypothetical protein